MCAGAVVLLLAGGASAQQPQPRPTEDVEVEPIICWWRTTTAAVRVGEQFGLTLTCSVVETEADEGGAGSVAARRQRRAAAAVRNPGRHAPRRSASRPVSGSSSTTTSCGDSRGGVRLRHRRAAARGDLQHREQAGQRRVVKRPRPDLLAAAHVDSPDLARAHRQRRHPRVGGDHVRRDRSRDRRAPTSSRPYRRCCSAWPGSWCW